MTSKYDPDVQNFASILCCAGWETVSMAQAMASPVPKLDWILIALIEVLDWDSDGKVYEYRPSSVLKNLSDAHWQAMWYALRTGTAHILGAYLRGWVTEDTRYERYEGGIYEVKSVDAG